MDNDWCSNLEAYGQLDADVPLGKHTTLAVGGAARWWFRPENTDALQQALPKIPDAVCVLPMGRGSNLLVSDAGFDGVVLDLGGLQQMGMNGLELHAQAGCRMSKVAQLAAQSNATGVEFMATVPGDVGGGVAMNAGAFGQQLSDVLLDVEVLHRDGRRETLSRQDLDMRYRWTALPRQSVVLSARLGLQAKDGSQVRQRMREMRQQRSQSQPLAQPNCGSVFKNPEGDYAARLIEAAGMKGHCIGDAQVSEQHANFIVNHGAAKADDVWALIQMIQEKVEQTSGVCLHTEVRLLGLNGVCDGW